jgi:hypothetical protein
VDASATHIGAGLHQRCHGSVNWELLGFFPKKLEPAQTDHKPLTYALSRVLDPLTTRQARRLNILQTFDT